MGGRIEEQPAIFKSRITVITNRVYNFQVSRTEKWNKESILNPDKGKYRKREVNSTKCNRRNKSKYIGHESCTRMYTAALKYEKLEIF